MNLIWNERVKKPNFDALSGDFKTDVLIVGGGLAGILAAYELHQAGIDYILIEAKEICSGITQNTTAKITAQHGAIYGKIIKKYGRNVAQKYFSANEEAVSRYKELCNKFSVNFETRDAYLYSRDDRELILKEISAYRAIGARVKFTKDTALPFEIAGAVKLENQGQINPLEFLYNLSDGLNIKEHTKLLELKDKVVVTDKGAIGFKKAIIATHFPIFNKHGLYFLKMYQHRSYVLALENAKDVGGMYIDADMKGLSFRNFKDYLLLGGGSHRTGKKGGSYSELLKFAEQYYPESEVASRFATQDCMTLDGISYIGQYSVNTPNLYVATGFNKWGFTNALVSAGLLRDMILGKTNDLVPLFSPSRSMLCGQLVINSFEAVTNLLTPTVPRCPHLGCALKYNKAEHSWDCACHGSRFDIDGRLLDNPATDDKKFS